MYMVNSRSRCYAKEVIFYGSRTSAREKRLFLYGFEPVSYTHLDVYKRQAVKRAKGMSGKPVTSKPVYGYLMDEDENYLVDEETAPVVQQIYQLCLAGNGPTKIISLQKHWLHQLLNLCYAVVVRWNQPFEVRVWCN